MKNSIFIVCVLLCPYLSFAQDFEWVRGMGSTFYNFAKGIGLDQAGNIYTLGTFEQTGDFDPSANTFIMTSAGEKDIFVQKMDAAGNFLWAISIGGTLDDAGESITVDAAGNIYITGYFQGTVDFDPSTGVSNLTSNGFYDSFVLKLDATGNLLWVQQFGANAYDEGTAIVVNNKGDVYASGLFSNTVDFDPSPAVFNMTANSALDIYTIKLGATTGNLLWAKRIPRTLGNNGIYELAVDQNDNVYSVGYFQGTVDFDPSVATYTMTSLGREDIFIQKLGANGNFLWATQMGSDTTDRGHNITIDKDGNVYATGKFSKIVDANPGASAWALTSNGDEDIFIQKLDPSGNLLWATSMGSSNFDRGLGIATDTSGNVYASGGYQGTVDFDPGVGVANLTASTNIDTDAYIQKLDKNGNFLWATSMGSSGIFEYAFDIHVDEQGNVYTTGSYDGGMDFDPGAGVVSIPTNGASDVYVLKLSQPPGIMTIPTLQKEQIQLYPNPSTGQVTVELQDIQEATLRVLDAQGKVVATPSIAQQNTHQLDLSFLPSGLYYISVVTDKSSSIVKLVKE